MSRSTNLVKLMIGVGVLLSALLLATSMPQSASAATRTCNVNWGQFKKARAKNVSCSVAKRTIKTWWNKGGNVPACYTKKGCKVGAFRCGVTWKGYKGNGRCSASRGRLITFSFG